MITFILPCFPPFTVLINFAMLLYLPIQQPVQSIRGEQRGNRIFHGVTQNIQDTIIYQQRF